MVSATVSHPALLGSVLAMIAACFQNYAPEPYMDEPFHIPQTQQYCKGHFHQWDPKITTLPGLYILGAAYAHLLQIALTFTSTLQAAFCNTVTLRSLNVTLGLVCFSVFHTVYRKVHPGVSTNFAACMALLMVLFPLHFFFHFLYYTDVGSLMFVLSAYLASLKHRYIASAVLGAWAVLFRQTNAVWVCFIIGVSVLERCASTTSLASTDTPQPQQSQQLSAKQQLQQSPQQPQPAHPLQQLIQQILHTVKAAWTLKWQLLQDMWALLLVPVAFAAFVVYNGGIVLGDKAAHAPVRHLMQPLYFVLFSALALAPFHFAPSRLKAARQLAGTSMQQQPVKFAVVIAAVGSLLILVIRKYTFAHPYLLADNRHYTFYLWKNWFARMAAAKYLLVPLYMYSTWSVYCSLAKRQSALWLLMFALCTAATVVPAWLVEFRYFTMPFAMVLLHMQPLSALQLKTTLMGFALVDAVSLYVYLRRPFVWPDGSIARFIW